MIPTRDVVEAYISQLPFNDVYFSYPEPLREKIIFGSYGQLKRRYRLYGEDFLTVEVVALQSLFLAEAEKEDFARYHRHGVLMMKVEDIMFSFKDGTEHISPEVRAIAAEIEEGQVIFGRLM